MRATQKHVFREEIRVADPRSKVREESYKATGVDIAEADSGLNRIVARVQKTWPKHGMGRVILPIGYYANVVEVDGVGLALCTDGVGSKTIIADMMKKYDTIGIDCVAMNVNDLICVGAKPLSLVDYIAVEKTDAAMLDAIGAGLCRGAEMAEISVSGGEIAQLRDVIRGFDLVAMAVGRVDLDKVIDGRNVAPGDVIIGVNSNGLHSNGYSLARRVFFESGRFRIDQKFDELGTTLGEELLRPTSIYVREAMEILENIRGVKALFNITGDGLLNLTRAAAPVGYEIEKPIEPQPIFGLIQRYGEVSDAEMFEVFNMGTGFCYVVDPSAVDGTISILKKHGREARPIGHTAADPEKKVRIPGHSLVGQGKKFRKDTASKRDG
jgi:phosphoribosylformylglycinamidine cyclo-ligase